MSSRARTRSRSASSSSLGTLTGCSPPIISNRTSRSASRRSVLTRSCAGRSIFPGAATTQPTPAAVQRARQPEPGRPRLVGDADRSGQPGAERRHLARPPRQPLHAHLTRRRVHHTRHRRRSVHVQTGPGANLGHGRFLLLGCGRRATAIARQQLPRPRRGTDHDYQPRRTSPSIWSNHPFPA